VRPQLIGRGRAWAGRHRWIFAEPMELVGTCVAFVVLRRLGLLGSAPIAVLLALAIGAAVANALAHRCWGAGCSRRQLHLRLAVEMAGITAVIYAIGWGPALGVGFVVIVARDLRVSGSEAWPPAAMWTVVGIAAGQLAIAAGAVTSYIRSPEVNGLAVLTALGLVFVIRELGQKTKALEDEAARRSRAEETQRHSEQRFRALVQNSPDVVTVTETTGRVVYVSPSVEAVMGYRPEDFVSTNGFDLVHPDDLARAHEVFDRVLAHPGQDALVELQVRHANGSWRWQEINFRNEVDNPAVAGVVVNHRDISERRAYQDQLAHEAYHDPLTGLANRTLFLERLNQALVRANRLQQRVAVLFVDLDRFKLINDSLGHNFGDQVLTATARRLTGCLRPQDTVARFAGDEFLVLLEDIVDATAVRLSAARLSAVLSEPIDVGAHAVVVTASVGVAISTPGEESAEELLHQADLAMYSAKEAGRAQSAMFDARTTRQPNDGVALAAAVAHGAHGAHGDHRLGVVSASAGAEVAV
jgi:diguanylate cyclase (GGDEF)-like protein/PAS domain S-box-containing protein